MTRPRLMVRFKKPPVKSFLERPHARQTVIFRNPVTPWLAVATQLADCFGDWRPVFFISAASGIVPLILIKLLVFDRPEDYKHITREELENSYRDELDAGILEGHDFKDVQQQIEAAKAFGFIDFFKNPSYLAVVVADIVIQIVYWGTMVWIPLYLSDSFGFKLAAMGFVNCCGYVAAALATKAFSALVIVEDGTKNYTPGWVFIALCAILGVVAACFIRTSAPVTPPTPQETAA